MGVCARTRAVPSRKGSKINIVPPRFQVDTAQVKALHLLSFVLGGGFSSYHVLIYWFRYVFEGISNGCRLWTGEAVEHLQEGTR